MDQTGFSHSQELLQAPPGFTPSELKPKPSPEQIARKKRLVIGISALIVILILLVLTTLVYLKTSTDSTTPSSNLLRPTPTPTLNPATREFREQLSVLEKQLKNSDPTEIQLKPPPLNYRLDLR